MSKPVAVEHPARERFREWLRANNARCGWEKEVEHGHLLRLYIWRHGSFIVHDYGEDGFEVYKACQSNDIDATLKWLDEA